MARQLSSEFKRECAELVLNYGYAHKDAAKTMNVSISSIQRWVTQYRKERQGITPKNISVKLTILFYNHTDEHYKNLSTTSLSSFYY